LTTGIFIDPEPNQPSCLHASLSLVSKNLATTEIIVIVNTCCTYFLKYIYKC